jgi:hypothetical protein
MNRDDLERGLERLTKDLESGRWDLAYSALRTQDYFDAGYRFIIVEAMGKPRNQVLRRTAAHIL